MNRNKRLAIAIVGMAALAVIFSYVPIIISVTIWLCLWFSGVVTDAPGPQPDLTWLEWLSYLMPAVAYLAILYVAVLWVRRAAH